MLTLCIDTATKAAVVALADDGELLAQSVQMSEYGHGEGLLAQIETALVEAGVKREEIERIGAGIGPGGFTSVRVGLATAKGLALARALPIVGVQSLPLMAASVAVEPGDYVVLLNAYRGDVFVAAYRQHGGGALQELFAPHHGNPVAVLERVRGACAGHCTFVGNAVASNLATIENHFGSRSRASDAEVPTPEALAALVDQAFRDRDGDDLLQLEPHYLRASDATLPAKR